MKSRGELPDARDGLTRKERVVLLKLAELQRENGGRNVLLIQLYDRVVEDVDMSQEELQAIVKRLAGIKLPTKCDYLSRHRWHKERR